MIYALGLGEALVGVTHECDYPPAAREKPAVVRNVLPIETMSEAEIDAAVSERLRQGLGLYELDVELIDRLTPDLIITQSLCGVCAPSTNEIAQLLSSLGKKPDLLWMSPSNLAGIEANLIELGAATARGAEAERLVKEGTARLARLAEAMADIEHRPRIFCMEWLDPVYCSGHWVPEMVRLAGGIDGLGQEGGDSLPIQWQAVLDWSPEILIFMPCGYRLDQALERAPALADLPGFADLPAARNGRIYVVDANAYFARPGPRVIEGTELLAHLIHPRRFSWHGPAGVYRA
jgi:iron complex transport system substrate-binding protein